MTMINVFRDVATVIGLAVPATVCGSLAREHVELVALANEIAQRIAFDTHDWTKLKTLATFTGTGAATSFALPADYKRMLKKARLWPSATPASPLTHYPDTDDWLGIDLQSFTPVIGAWTIIGTSVYIKPTVANAATVKFYYLTNLIVDPATGANKAEIDMDDDTFLLDERVLRLGIIWQWLANKGRPYAEHMATYETALANAIGSDKGSNIIIVGSGRKLRADEFAFPGVLGP